MSDSDNDAARAMEAYAQAEAAGGSDAAREAAAEAERQAAQAAIDPAEVAKFDPPAPAPEG